MTEWNQCDAHALRRDDNGRDTVVICNLDLHVDRSDASGWHFDEELDIYWKYAEDFYEDE